MKRIYPHTKNSIKPIQKINAKKFSVRVYLDHAATTYTDSRVLRVMTPFFDKNFGNASAIYKEGRDAKTVLENARKNIAGLTHARAEEIIFTGGGTEGNNLAIKGVVFNYIENENNNNKLGGATAKFQKPHIITTNIEHHSVLTLVEHLEKIGKIEATYIKVKPNGIVDPRDIETALKENTILVSVMYANNEIGTVQPISEIAKIIRNYKQKKLEIKNYLSSVTLVKEEKLEIDAKMVPPYFHTDACQAAEYLEMNVQKLGADLITVNGSKMYGPKGIGFLYVKKGIKLSPIMYGGGQEFGLRPGTENIASIVGLSEAFNIAQAEKEKESRRLTALRDYFIKKLNEIIPNIVLNGDPIKRLPNNVNVSILGIEGEAASLYLDEKGVACSTGSACTSASLDPSHVIMALGAPYEYANGSLRFSLGKKTTKSELNYVLKVLPLIVEKLRQLSPVNFKELAKNTESH